MEGNPRLTPVVRRDNHKVLPDHPVGGRRLYSVTGHPVHVDHHRLLRVGEDIGRGAARVRDILEGARLLVVDDEPVADAHQRHVVQVLGGDVEVHHAAHVVVLRLVELGVLRGVD